MSYLRVMCGMNIMKRIWNLEIKSCGITRSITSRAEKGLLKWFGPLKGMKQNRMTRRVYEYHVEGRRGWGCTKKGWKVVKRGLSARGLDPQQVCASMLDRSGGKCFLFLI